MSINADFWMVCLAHILREYSCKLLVIGKTFQIADEHIVQSGAVKLFNKFPEDGLR